ncbi:hypothetical protein Lal_00018588 [Lupinus albus]|nr:hypothetical protein Lal_00018588 [Lupinus albus]
MKIDETVHRPKIEDWKPSLLSSKVVVAGSDTYPSSLPRRAFHRISSEMSSIGTSKGILEIAKFGVYVAVPIVLMYAFANNTKNLQKFMGNKSYVEYPPEAPRPPPPEELREMARELARKRNNP